MLVVSKHINRGYSLLEAVIVIGLVAIIAAILVPSFYRYIQTYRAETAVEQIAMNIRFARMAAVKKRRNYRIVINEDPTNSYEVQLDENKDGSFEKYKNADTSIASGLTILSGTTDTITFNARGSAAIVGGSTIRVKSNDDNIYRINVYATGAVTKVKE